VCRSALCPFPFSSALRAPRSLCWVFLFSSLFIIQFLVFFAGWGSVYPGGYAGLPQGSCGNSVCCLFAHLFICIFQAGLEPVSGSVGDLLFSQCNMVCAGDLGCWSFNSFWWFFFSAKCSSSISKKFLIYGAHAFCFCTLVTILDPPPIIFVLDFGCTEKILLFFNNHYILLSNIAYCGEKK
jgi:hypothetical protein